MRTHAVVLTTIFLTAGAATAWAGKHGRQWDTTPDPFQFTDVIDAPLNTAVTSDSITVSGINTSTSIEVSGGAYSVNGGTFTTATASVDNGDVVQVQQISAPEYATTTDTVLTIGGVSDTFSVTTLADDSASDTTPDPFTFSDQTGVPLSTVIISDAISVAGIDAATEISVNGGEYSVNGGDYSASSGTVNNGDSVIVRQTSASTYETTTDTVLTIGGVSDTFSVTTESGSGSGEFTLLPASGGDPWFASEHFSGSANCQRCHNGLTDENGQDVSIQTDWSSSLMANASRDPFWRAKVRSELNRNPALAPVINDKCTRCHAPMANEEARKHGEAFKVLDDGVLSSDHPHHNAALDGVSCTLCHQIKDSPKLGTLEGFSGHYEVDSFANAADRRIYGPYDSIFAGPMRNNVEFTPVFSSHVKESKLCATCHNLKTPYVDEFGNLLSTSPADEFPEQMPYSEWLHSRYAGKRSCQGCHMGRADGVVMASRPKWLDTKRNNFAIHDLIGGNKLMLDILANNREQLGVLATNFAETMAKTDAMLQGAASISVAESQLADGVLDFSLQITSATGHKLPTSFPSRRIVLHVKVTDAAGNAVFESGRINADGSVVGVDADGDGARFEPHHELITREDEVQVYEAIMGNNHGEVTYTLLRAMTYLKDNRLLPEGFDKSTAPDDIRVVGAAASDPDFLGGGDRVRYRIEGLGSGPYTVDARLIYQPLAHAFARDLFAGSGGEISDFEKMFDASNQKSTVMTTTQFIAK